MAELRLAAAFSACLAALAGPALAADGAELFAGTCAACHGEGGIGFEGLAPPLVDAELWTALGDKAPLYLAGVMAGGLSGKLTVAGVDYVGLVMPPQTEIPDADLAAIGAYVLKDLNKLPTPFDETAVAAAKAAPPTHKALRAMRKGQ